VTWPQRMVDHMRQAKTCGLPFHEAWGTALARYPYQPSDLGVRLTAVDEEQESLFEQPAYQALEWYRQVCEAAYEDRPGPDGGRSRLAGLRFVLDGFGDGSRAAGKPGRHRAAAA
jgi:hypothetical protein